MTDQKTGRIVLFDHVAGQARLIIALKGTAASQIGQLDTPLQETALEYLVARVEVDINDPIASDKLLAISKDDFRMLLEAGRAADLSVIAGALDRDASSSIPSLLADIVFELGPNDADENSFASQLLATLKER